MTEPLGEEMVERKRSRETMKFFRAALMAVLVGMLVFPGQAMAYRHFIFKRKAPYRLTARAALLWDPVNNRRYLDLRADAQVFPASTEKVLTALLVLEHLSLDQYIRIGPNCTRVPPSKLGLRAGEYYRVRDLLYGLLLKSANDVAVALAEAVAGSEGRFVDMMNARAREIGAVHSHFANPNGLPTPGVTQFTTAWDMALILNQALKNDFFRQAITLKYMVIHSRAGRGFLLRSHDRTLFFRWRRPVFGKTGYTIEAQHCFLGYVPLGGGKLIIAVYGCRRRWTDIKFILEHYGHVGL